MEYDELSFVLTTEKRTSVLVALRTPATPLMIAKETKITKEHVSRLLKKFVEMGLAECKTPGKRKGKIFELTAKGREILMHIDDRRKME